MPFSLNKFDSFPLALAQKKHDLTADQLEIALTLSSPNSGNQQLSDISQISYTNLSARTLVILSATQTSGIFKLLLQDKILYASGIVAPFRYIVVFNQTSTNDLLIGWYDYGAEVNLQNNETFTIDFDDVAGFLTFG